MEPVSVLLLAAVITKMITTYREDIEFARRGVESPRHKLKMAMLDAALKQMGKERVKTQKPAKPPARPGAKGYMRELWYDAWDDLTDHRKRVRQERKDGVRPTVGQRVAELRGWSKRSLNKGADGKPVDDMLDVAGVRGDARSKGSQPTTEANGHRTACPECKATLTLVNGEWQHPKGSDCGVYGLNRFEVDLAESPTSVVHDDDFYVLKPSSEVRQVACPRCGREHPETDRATVNGERACPRCAAEFVHQLAGNAQPAASTPQPAGESSNLATVTPLFQKAKEISMNTEATGLATAIAFAEAAAEMHAGFSTAGNEGYVGDLERLEMGETYLASAREAQEASTIAAAKWTAHAEGLRSQTSGQEFYRSNPDAAGKQALINE